MNPDHVHTLADLKAACAAKGIEIVYTEGTCLPPPLEFVIRIEPPLPPILGLRTTAFERANPNQPWYAKFQKRRPRK